MFKKLFLLICIVLLSNCTTTSTALLGPIFTGAKTGSVYQASISYGGNQIFDQMKKRGLVDNFNKINRFKSNLSTQNKYPFTLNLHQIDKTRIIKPELLP
tara:strand:+ start:256 stop:555 length:300 start_codon:yes stop_codon:yes gene_type:complete